MDFRQDISLSSAVHFEGFLGHSWPSKAYYTDFKKGDWDPHAPKSNRVLSIPAIAMAGWRDEVIRALLVECKLELSSGSLSDALPLDYWESILGYACEHHLMDLLYEMLRLSEFPEATTAPDAN